jgi:hypothetical protein
MTQKLAMACSLHEIFYQRATFFVGAYGFPEVRT